MEKLPLIITRGIITLPHTNKHVEIGRDLSKSTLEYAKENELKLIFVAQKDSAVDEPTFDDIYKVGTLVKIKKIAKQPDGSYDIDIKGEKRVEIHNFINLNNDGKTILTCEYTELKEKNQKDEKSSQLINEILEVLVENQDDILNAKTSQESKQLVSTLESSNNNSGKVADIIGCLLNSATAVKQSFLEELDVHKRLKLIFSAAMSEFSDTKNAQKVDAEINKKMTKQLSKQQKEFYLREKLKIIKEELGELGNREDEVDKINKLLEENPYPENIKQKIKSELNKYEVAFNSNESSVIKSYIDWLIELPWWQETEDASDLNQVQDTLDKNHYGLTKAKERIIEYLSVRLKNKHMRGPIICLVGPPGVGKTSLANSIAEALKKEYVKVSLGGVRDESEIRGHRKTYVGAMPGRIIKGMKKAGVTNPLFLLDEIDKMASDNRGDPASAMLEVLDPEQNKRFSDNYIEEEYDLSNVMFIATANYYNQIPYALVDRLEIIELSSYTANEKREIAKSHLITRVLDEALIKPKSLKFTDAAIDFIVNHYTREAGVRELERLLRRIVRKYVVAQLKGQTVPSKITDKEVVQYLGKKIFDPTLKDKNSIAGIVNGMAYTSAGGDLMPIEASYSKGKGKIVITGNLEKTMSESVSVALGYVKANAKKFGIDEDIFQNIDLHIHVPAGGVPKDGPSAGVALTTAIISALTNSPVSTNVSMTGEITLRGKVGIIGGVKEKIISAYRAGVRDIFLPDEDERYLEDVPKEILDDIKIHLVNTYDQIHKELFKKVSN